MLEQLGQLGHYNLLERVGAGGLGPAFKARDTVVGRTVLVKNVAEALGSDPGARTRFLRDQRAAATISHPNVATLFEVADRPDQLLLVFEFVSGQTLEELLAERPPEVRQSLDLGVQLVEAIGAAHSQGVLHLDVRPANIKISLRGHAKLLDTGLSAWTRGGRAGSGSVDDRAVRDRDDRYRSPEQRRGEAPDPGSDLYSIGVVLSEMLAGRAPADGASPGRATRPGSEPDTAAVPPELAAIVKRAMAEQVEDRYQSAVSFGAELRSVAAILDIRSGEREPPSRVTATEEPSQRSSGWVIPFLAVLALAFGAWLWLR
jgi:serine/threonine protein kinase